MNLAAPIDHLATCRVNQTKHGRSIFRCEDVPGHNVFKGYTTWANTHRCVGDAVDLAGPVGAPVYAVADGRVTYFSNDGTKLEVVAITCGNVEAWYAHVNLSGRFRLQSKVKRGEQLGVLLPLASGAHLHFELWVDGQALTQPTPAALRAKVVALCAEPEPVRCINIETGEVLPYVLAEGGDHITDQRKVYLRRVT